VVQEEPQVEIEKDPRGVVFLRLNRPAKRNALSLPLLESALEHLSILRQEDRVALLVLEGKGEHFCAGGDLKFFLDQPPSLARKQGEKVRDLFISLLTFPAPVIAFVRGYCLAGGLGMALCGDLIVAHRNALLGVPEVKVGLFPYMVSILLFRSLSQPIARDLLFTGRMISAEEAFSMGMVSRVVDGDWEEEKKKVLNEILSFPPDLLRKGKMALIRHGEREIVPLLYRMEEEFYSLLSLEETKDRLRTFFETPHRSP